MANMTQRAAICEHLKEGKSLTPIEALMKFSCFRLAARIGELRDEGHPIDTTLIKEDGKTYARYEYRHQPRQQQLFGT